MLTLDHIVISSKSLAIGQAFIENKLGIRADTGGEHKLFGTHNKLISLGDTYLEVIAVSPDLIPETSPRWFNLDHFNGPPTITNWVCGANFGEFAPSDLMNGNQPIAKENEAIDQSVYEELKENPKSEYNKIFNFLGEKDIEVKICINFITDYKRTLDN